MFPFGDLEMSSDIPQVTVFSQEDIPAFNSEGRFLLQEKGKLVTAPSQLISPLREGGVVVKVDLIGSVLDYLLSTTERILRF